MGDDFGNEDELAEIERELWARAPFERADNAPLEEEESFSKTARE